MKFSYNFNSIYFLNYFEIIKNSSYNYFVNLENSSIGMSYVDFF